MKENRDQVHKLIFNVYCSKDTVVLIAVNVSADSREITVRQGTKSFAYTLPSHAAVTFTWQPQD
ncbi:glycoside hydrolase family 30 beta sandwich domain-containing protein [Paenibacillus enshidis]|uniref:Glycoside hydrolase family 30 beta sandwich domain-containing protein n=1 Tax=Paenibacillus enshidis TaxID=1458439 RepID=A0ABV5AUF7_9BACL